MRLVGIALATAAMLLPAAVAAQSQCGIYPEAVVTTQVYAGYSDCKLRNAGEPRLWEGLPDGAIRITRFVFSAGHSQFWRVVTITERDDSSGELVAGGEDTPYRGRREVLARHEVQLSRQKLAELNSLIAGTGTFDFEVGSWDGEEVFLHCELLEMEQASAAGYRYSSVNIGCNQPQRLMPLVREIAVLAGLEFSAGGQIIR